VITGPSPPARLVRPKSALASPVVLHPVPRAMVTMGEGVGENPSAAITLATLRDEHCANRVFEKYASAAPPNRTRHPTVR